MNRYIAILFSIFLSMPLSACEKIFSSSSSQVDSPPSFEPSTLIKDKNHPRVLLTADHLNTILSRMYGENARAPYSDWFNLIKNAEDNNNPVDLVNLALIYKATKDINYKNKFINRIPQEGVPGLKELYAIDIMFNELSDSIKLDVMKRVASKANPWYANSVAESKGKIKPKWGYHRAHRVVSAFAYSAIFADTEFELNKDSNVFPFNANNYIKLVQQQLSDEGYFWQIENRIAGSSEFNNALEGDKGGMYDNIGYDSVEESYSIFLHLQYFNLTGDDRYKNALHDKYRAHFYQNMSVPYTAKHYDRQKSCRKANTTTHNMAQIWNTGSSQVTQPSLRTVAVTAFLYQDPKMQYYANNGKQHSLCKAPYNNLFWDLIYYDDSLIESPLENNPTASYFSGPGIVTMRSDWSDNATFGVFMSGEGIGRRYEDANSFLISRKTEVIPHGGARVRFNDDNRKHFWYHTRSIAKNTIQIYDPQESYDINKKGDKEELYSGTPLVDSDNIGGQIFEIPPSNEDLCFNTYRQCTEGIAQLGRSFPLGVYETANITKYQHSPDEFTYSVGDATDAYSNKIEYFEREFFFLRPDVFIIFDRVKAIKSNFKKVWSIHTVDEPKVEDENTITAMGMKKHLNAKLSSINNDKNNTYIDLLVPTLNTVTIRGGDTTLSQENTLTAIQDITLDIPRWLEIFVAGSDVEGTLTIRGETSENSVDFEEIIFDGRVTQLYTANSGIVSEHSILDVNANWQIDEWKNKNLAITIDGKKFTTKIIGNTKDTLFGNFNLVGRFRFKIEQPIANSYKHWKKINSVSSTDMNIENIQISTPHYFDTEDVKGRLHSFAPHTDFKDDKYKKKADWGQWTLNIEATTPKLLDNFLNVVSLKDPDKRKPNVELIKSINAYGALVDDTLIVFAKDNKNLTDISLIFPNNTKKLLMANLVPDSLYSYKLNLDGQSSYEVEVAIELAGENSFMTSSSGIGRIAIKDINNN